MIIETVNAEQENIVVVMLYWLEISDERKQVAET